MIIADAFVISIHQIQAMMDDMSTCEDILNNDPTLELVLMMFVNAFLGGNCCQVSTICF